LKEAINEFRQLQKDDESRFKEYQDNVLYDLYYSGQFQEMLDEAAGLAMTDARKNLIVAATAIAQNVELAEKKCSELSIDDSARNKILISAGQLALRMREYDKGTALLRAGTQGASDSRVTQAQIAAYAKTRKVQAITNDSNDPTIVVQKLVRIWFRLDSTPEQYFPLMSKNALGISRAKDISDTETTLPVLRTIVINSGLPPDVFMDFMVSNMRITKEGDDERGYRISLQSPGAATQYMYVIKENGGYKLLATGNGKEVGREVVDRLAKGDIVSARTMLDFARDRQPLSGGDDPLAGNLFPRFWTRGQDASEQTMRAAALALIVGTDFTKNYLSDLEAASQTAAQSQRTAFDLALALAYDKVEDWQKLKTTSQRLLTAYPRSDRALALFGNACIQLKAWKDGEAAVHDRLTLDSENLAGRRLSARLLAAEGKFDQSMEELRKLAEDGRATPEDLNMFAWSALFVPVVPNDAVEAAERANALTQDRQFGILHTLACLYAEVGKTVEARALLNKALETSHLGEPNEALWYGYGRLAELYGQADAAIGMYQRIERPEDVQTIDAFSTYNLAQHRVAGLAAHSSKEVALRN
jgi:tetratricopeptide (TPR) repeat protein